MLDRYLGSLSIEIAEIDIDTPMLPSGGLDVLVRLLLDNAIRTDVFLFPV